MLSQLVPLCHRYRVVYDYVRHTKISIMYTAFLLILWLVLFAAVAGIPIIIYRELHAIGPLLKKELQLRGIKLKDPRRRLKIFLIGLLLCIIVLVTVLLVNYKSYYRRILIGPLLPHLSEYTNIPDLINETNSVEPHIVGKVVLIDLFQKTEPNSIPKKMEQRPGYLPWILNMEATKQINFNVFRRLPSRLRADTHNNVGTIIWLAWDVDLAGEYSIGGYRTGTGSYRITCHMTIVDRKRRTVIGENDFIGGPPPKKKDFNLKPGFGSKPTSRIINYIKSLPMHIDQISNYKH